MHGVKIKYQPNAKLNFRLDLIIYACLFNIILVKKINIYFYFLLAALTI